LLDTVKCWLNTVWQVLAEAPALRSLIVHDRKDVADILQFPFHIRGDLRELILKNCCFGEDGDGCLSNIVALYSDLEVLSLSGCHPLTSTGYCLIARLKKLSDLNLTCCQVDYMYAKSSETHVCIRNSTGNIFHIFRQEGNLLQF
jgi:hypothetical protein